MSDANTRCTLSEEVDFEVIVIGAGIAGSVAAYQLANQGKSVLLIERGSEPGAKNLSGGVLYTHSMLDVFPDLLDEAPIERVITRNYINFLNQDSSVAVDYKDARLGEPGNAVSVLRGPFDAWLASKAEEAGAFIMPGIRVDSLLMDNGRVYGVKAGDDELTCHVVVAADGINSFIARDAGLRPAPKTNQLAVGVKAVLGLPAEVIEDRFSVQDNEGSAWACVGDCTEGIGGGGFLYTNKESISIGVVLRLDDLVKKQKRSTDVFDHFLDHPIIAPYLKDAELLEYGCHLVAEGGLAMMGDITHDGLVIVGDAAGLTLNTGLTIRGMDLAAGSATAAATGILEALTAGDVSKAGLAGYPKALFDGFAGKDMQTYSRAPGFLERDRMYNDYGDLLANILYNVYRHDLTPRKHLLNVARQALKDSPISIWNLASDGIAGVRAL